MEERLLSLMRMLLQPIISFLLCLMTSYTCSQTTEMSSLHAPKTFVPLKKFFLMEQETLHVSSCLQTKGTYAEVQKLIRILIPSNFFQELAPSATLPIFDLFRLREE